MILSKIKYSEYEGENNSWYLEETELEKINLIVGNNASGKTRTINVIAGLAKILSGILNSLFDSGTYFAEFIDNADVYIYELKLFNKNVVNESLKINDEIKLERDQDGKCKIFAFQLNSFMDIKVPKNQLVAVIRRDEIQHPYLEKIYLWAYSMSHYQFGTPLGRESGLLISDPKKINVDYRDNNQVTAMFLKGINDYGSDFENEIIKNMGIVGYMIDNIGVGPNPNVSILAPGGFPVHLLFAKETDRSNITFQNEMSQGMFRVLSLLIQIAFFQKINIPSMIIIDDIGEGIDFDRSEHLINLLITSIYDSPAQLIMSTNDKFVMNNVALKYWQVIKRNNNICKLYNYKNSENIFKDFEFTGLSNFDFLATKFYEKGLE